MISKQQRIMMEVITDVLWASAKKICEEELFVIKGKRKVVSVAIIICMLTGLLTLTSFGLTPASPAFAADEYDTMRLKWKELLDGGPNLDTQDSDIASKISTISSLGNTYWTSLNKASNRTYLWSDLTAGATNSYVVTSNYDRLADMTQAYSTLGSSLYNNAALRADIISALDWMDTHWFTSEGTPNWGNWWDWDIGTPQRLARIMIMLNDYLTTTQKTNYIAAIDSMGVDITSAAFDDLNYQGGNRSDVLLVNLACGIVGKSSARLTNVRNEMSPLFNHVTISDGLYADGSFIQHGDVAYTGTYGIVFLDGVSSLLYMLNGTTWAITDPDLQNIYKSVYDTFRPIIYRGSAMEMVRGRAITRELETGYSWGHSLMNAFAMIAETASATDKANYKSMLKYMVQQDASSNVYTDVSIGATVLIKKIMNDSGVTPSGELIKHYEYASMDKTVHLAQGFGFAVSRSSKRVQNYEMMNDENGKGWTTGDGMTYIYNNDPGQFAGNFWPTVNPLRLPGTTVEVRSRYYNHPQNGDGEGNPTNNWSGGVTLGNYGVSGMNLIPLNGSTTGSLNAYKSWFMFDDEVVNLGSKITASSGYVVESIVENRKLNTAGNNALLVNGTAKSTSVGWSENMTGVNWMHLAGNVTGSDIGYYFPGGASVSGLRQQRTGAWYDITHTGSTTPHTERYMTLYYNHGTNPSNASYSYVLLPNKTSSQVSDYASNPDITVLENSSEVSAVKENTLHLTGANFWKDMWKKIGGITVNKKASVMMQEVPGASVELAVSDPTMENTGTIIVDIDRPATGTVYTDPGISIVRLTPTIQFAVNVNNAKGKTFKAKFNTEVMNYAVGADVTYSSTYNESGWSPQAVADGQQESFAPAMGWTSSSNLTINHTEWVALDMGSSNTIHQINLYPRNDVNSVGNFFPVDFTIQLSEDNINWTTVVTQTGYAKPGNAAQKFVIPPQTARYVKVHATNLRPAAGEYRMQLAEIGVWNYVH